MKDVPEAEEPIEEKTGEEPTPEAKEEEMTESKEPEPTEETNVEKPAASEAEETKKEDEEPKAIEEMADQKLAATSRSELDVTDEVTASPVTSIEEKKAGAPGTPAEPAPAAGDPKKEEEEVRCSRLVFSSWLWIRAPHYLCCSRPIEGRKEGKICVMCSRRTAWLHMRLFIHRLTKHLICVRLSITEGVYSRRSPARGAGNKS